MPRAVAALALVVTALAVLLLIELRAPHAPAPAGEGAPARPTGEATAAPSAAVPTSAPPNARPQDLIGHLPPAAPTPERPLSDARFAGKTRTAWRSELKDRIATLQADLESARRILGPPDSDMAWTEARGDAKMRIRDLELRIARDQELLRDVESAR